MSMAVHRVQIWMGERVWLPLVWKNRHVVPRFSGLPKNSKNLETFLNSPLALQASSLAFKQYVRALLRFVFAFFVNVLHVRTVLCVGVVCGVCVRRSGVR